MLFGVGWKSTWIENTWRNICEAASFNMRHEIQCHLRKSQKLNMSRRQELLKMLEYECFSFGGRRGSALLSCMPLQPMRNNLCMLIWVEQSLKIQMRCYQINESGKRYFLLHPKFNTHIVILNALLQPRANFNRSKFVLCFDTSGLRVLKISTRERSATSMNQREGSCLIYWL